MDTVTRWLHLRGILLGLDVADRREALLAVGELAGRTHGLDATPVFRALWRREMASSTGVGNGLAIPHARIGMVTVQVTFYVRTRTPLDFAAPDGKPVAALFVILVPADDAVERNLLLLAAAAEAFSDCGFRGDLAAAIDAEGVAAVFARWLVRAQAAVIA